MVGKKIKYILLILAVMIILPACSSTTFVIDSSNSDDSNNNSSKESINKKMYDNVIPDRTFDRNYTVICWKNGELLSDINNAGESTRGGNCEPGNRGFVIEQNERTGAERWAFAKETCVKDDMRLPNEFEFQIACRYRDEFNLEDMINNWEWASNDAYPHFSDNSREIITSVIGDGGCNFGSHKEILRESGDIYETNYRCVR